MDAMTGTTTAPTKWHGRKKAPEADLDLILSALEIKIIPTTKRRRDMETAAGETLSNLLALHGPQHLTITLRSIVETGANAGALIDPIIRAMSAVILAHPAWVATGGQWLEALDGCDLMAWYDAAKGLKKSAPAPGWSYLAGMLSLVLRESFADVTKRPRSRADRREAREEREAAEAERKTSALIKSNAERIEIGRQLIEIKRAAGWRGFQRQVHRALPKFDVAKAPDYIRIAERYADRPELWQRAPWCVLVALSSPTLPAKRRADFERRIEAGEKIMAKSIDAARTKPRVRRRMKGSV